MKVTAYIHTHWDREWYQPFQEFRLRLIEAFDKILEDLETGKLDQFYFDGQTIALDDYLEIFPDKEKFIKKFIQEKKLFIGPWYALADEFLVSGESLIRNLLIGINESKEYGCNNFIGYLPDAFGHIAKMPQIFESFNIKNSIVWRGIGEQNTEFIWKSEDGSKVLASYLIQGYFQDILNSKQTIEEKSQLLKEFLAKIKPYVIQDSVLLPIGADHLSSPVNLNEQIKQINKHINEYKIESTNLFNYIQKTNENRLNLSEIKGELRDNSKSFILPGTFSTRLYLKQQNAVSGWKLNKLAEPLQTYCDANKISPSRKNQLEYAWKILLQNHPHDSICGCSADSVHNQMETRFDEVNQISDGIIGRCFRDISKLVKDAGVILYNASDYEYTGLVNVKTHKLLPVSDTTQLLKISKEFPSEVLYDIQKAPVQEDVTLHKEYLIWVENIKPHTLTILDESYKCKNTPSGVNVGYHYIENSKIKVQVNEDGSLSILDKITDRKYENIHVIEDRADIGDTYNFVPLKDYKTNKAKLLESRIVDGPGLQSVLRLIYEINIREEIEKEKAPSSKLIKHTITIDLLLKAESPYLEFDMKWDNKSKDHILQLKFNLTEPVSQTVSEDNLGLIKRDFNPGYSLDGSMPAEKGKELKTNTAAMQRFVWAQGLGIITEGLSEYGVKDNQLYITLLRSVGILSKGYMETRGLAAGPPIETPGAQCIGERRARYAITFCDDPKKLFKLADNFMGCILSSIGTNIKTSKKVKNKLFEINNKNIYSYAIKSPFNNKDKGVIIRLLNLDKETQQIKINSSIFKTHTELNSLEEDITKPQNLSQEISFKPYELKTYLLK